jgi:hypothetical protein
MKHFAHYTAAIIVTIFFLSCTKDTQPTKEERGTGLLPNTPASLEKIMEADFDENKFNLPANFALDGPPIKGKPASALVFRVLIISSAYIMA